MDTVMIMNYIEKAHIWKIEPSLDDALKTELNTMNEEQLEDAFHTDLAFGTGGLRGLMGAGTNRINIYTIRRAALGLGRYLLTKAQRGLVVISYDNRHDSRRFAFESALVLSSLGLDCQVFEHLRPTPMLSFAVRHLSALGGIMITASHNPKEYNGFKAYNHTGAQLNLEEADQVIKAINAIEDVFAIDTMDDSRIKTIDESFDDLYLNQIASVCPLSGNKHLHIIYSPLHGTGGTVIPKLLSEKGYRVEPYAPEMRPDPDFSSVLSSNPEDPRSFVNTIRYADDVDADLIMVTDPDADRLGVGVRTKDGVILLNGNETAALVLYDILESKKADHSLPENGVVYTTIVTTDLIETIASAYGVKTIKTLTGFKFIGEQAELNQSSTTYLFGAEESYGSLISDVVRDKDAVQAVCRLAQMASVLKSKGQTLLDLLEQISKRFGAHAELTQSLTLKGIEGLEKIKDIMDHVRHHPPLVNGQKPVQTADYQSGMVTDTAGTRPTGLPQSNVIKYHYGEGTWVVFRPSGTEPKLKIYVGTREKTMSDAKARATNISNRLIDTIKSI